MQQKSAFATAREIAQTHGWGSAGLNKAITSTLMRHGIFNMIYFSFYHNVKNVVPKCQINLRAKAKKIKK